MLTKKLGKARTGILNFMVVLLISTFFLTYMLFSYVSKQYLQYELQLKVNSVRRVYEEMVNQADIMQDIAVKIRSTWAYSPGVLKRNSINRLDMLSDFKYFSNYSSLLSRYFLIYQNENKVYTSEGFTSDFVYYLPSVTGRNIGNTASVLSDIQNATTNCVVKIGEHRIVVIPIRFVNASIREERAALCFILTEKEISDWLSSVIGDLPDNMSIFYEKELLYQVGENTGVDYDLSSQETKQIDKNHYITAFDGTRIKVVSECLADPLPKVLSDLPFFVYLGLLFAFIVFAAFAVIIYKLCIQPTRRLIKKYAVPVDYYTDEFVELDHLIGKIQEESEYSTQLLRDRVLLTILHGYYSDRVIDTLDFLHLEFTKNLYRVGIINDKTGYDYRPSIQSIDDVYVLKTEKNDCLVLIFQYNDQNEYNLKKNAIFTTLQDGDEYYNGKEVSIPQLLSVSYLDALAARDGNNRADGQTTRSLVVLLMGLIQRGNLMDANGKIQEIIDSRKYYNTHKFKHFAIEFVRDMRLYADEIGVKFDDEQLNELSLLPSVDLFLDFAIALMDKCCSTYSNQNVRRMERVPSDIVEYIDDNMADADLCLEKISDIFGISCDYVSQLVKSYTGMAFKEYLTNLRMRKASVLLKENSDLTVNEICEKVGYHSASNFIKKFKATYGVTPSSYR